MNAYAAFLVELRDWCSRRYGWGADPPDSAALLATLLVCLNIITLMGLWRIIGDRGTGLFSPDPGNKLVLLGVAIPIYLANRMLVRRQVLAAPNALRPFSLRSRIYVYGSVLAYVIGLLLL